MCFSRRSRRTTSAGVPLRPRVRLFGWRRARASETAVISCSSSSTRSACFIQSSCRSATSSAMKPSPKRSCCRRASITRTSLLRGPRPGFLFLLPLLSQLFSVQGGEGTPNLPKGGPGLLCPAGGFGMLRRNVQRAALAILSISNIEVWPVEVLGVAIAGTTGIAATARGLRQAALDHGLRSTEESLYEPPLLTYSLILR